jgi:hypothetical protein
VREPRHPLDAPTEGGQLGHRVVHNLQ